MNIAQRLHETAQKAKAELEAKQRQEQAARAAAALQKLEQEGEPIIQAFLQRAEQLALNGHTQHDVCTLESPDYIGPVGPCYQVNPFNLRGLGRYLQHRLIELGFEVCLRMNRRTIRSPFDDEHIDTVVMSASW